MHCMHHHQYALLVDCPKYRDKDMSIKRDTVQNATVEIVDQKEIWRLNYHLRSSSRTELGRIHYRGL